MVSDDVKDKALNGSRYLAKALKTIGTTHVFFMEAILRETLIELKKLGTERVLAHSEKAVAYMADGYARITGKVGVCLSQSVGAANLAAGLQDPFLNRTPVLALTGRKPPMFQHRNAYQEIPHGPLFDSVTKFHANVAMADKLPLILAQALREATADSPRPVHLDLCGLCAEYTENDLVETPFLPSAGLGAISAQRPFARPSQIEAAVKILSIAEKPVIVVGTGSVQAQAGEAVKTLAEALQVPIATSMGGRGIVPTTHPLHIGVVGNYSAPPTNELVHIADLVIYVGCHTGDQPTLNWTVPAPGTPIIQIDADAREIGRNYPNVTPVHGDPRMALVALYEACSQQTPRSEWANQCRKHFSNWHQSMEPFRESDATPIRPERLCHEISEFLPEDAVLVADTGYSGIWTATMIELKHPGQTYLRAAGSLGWAFPAALGVKCGAPDRPVVCFTGDGAFYYHLSELETARRKSLPVVTVINNNSAFGQCVTELEARYGDTQGILDDLIRFGPCNFAEIAKAFGVEGIRVENPAEIGAALERAISLQAPVVVDVVTDQMILAPVAWTPSRTTVEPLSH